MERQKLKTSTEIDVVLITCVIYEHTVVMDGKGASTMFTLPLPRSFSPFSPAFSHLETACIAVTLLICTLDHLSICSWLCGHESSHAPCGVLPFKPGATAFKKSERNCLMTSRCPLLHARHELAVNPFGGMQDFQPGGGAGNPGA